MKSKKPFWERDINPITGYKVESYNDCKNRFEDEGERTYAMSGKRHTKHTTRINRRKTKELNECVILSNEL
jgi:hypothetical protein